MPLTPLVPVEQAAITALATWLSDNLPGVVVSDRWPSPEEALPPLAITILQVGTPREEYAQPETDPDTGFEVIHAAITPKITFGTIASIPAACATLEACRSSYEAHRVDTTAHAVADTTHTLTAPTAVDLPTACVVANEQKAVLSLHVLATPVHVTPDQINAVTAPDATDAASLYRLTVAIASALTAHYVARLYTWRLGELEITVQLDVWAAYEATRAILLAQLKPLLRASPLESAGIAFEDGPRDDLVLALAGEWAGNYACAAISGAAGIADTADQAARGEWRATLNGTVTVASLVKAQSPRLALGQLRSTNLASGVVHTATVTSGDPHDTYT